MTDGQRRLVGLHPIWMPAHDTAVFLGSKSDSPPTPHRSQPCKAEAEDGEGTIVQLKLNARLLDVGYLAFRFSNAAHHSRASFCASAICAGVIILASSSRRRTPY